MAKAKDKVPWLFSMSSLFPYLTFAKQTYRVYNVNMSHLQHPYLSFAKQTYRVYNVNISHTQSVYIAFVQQTYRVCNANISPLNIQRPTAYSAVGRSFLLSIREVINLHRFLYVGKGRRRYFASLFTSLIQHIPYGRDVLRQFFTAQTDRL